MFPIAHAWLVQQLAPAATDAHLLGCVWPDMLFHGPLDHTGSRRSGRLLAQHAMTISEIPEGPTFRAFVFGVLTHGVEPRGFDWYSDEAYGDGGESARGYAFQLARPLAAPAARACGVELEHGWWKAHNIVEMAFERTLWSEGPLLGDGIARACADEQLLTCITHELARVFSVPQTELFAAIQRFPDVVTLRPNSVTTLAEVYALQTRLKHPYAAPDIGAIADLIAHGERLIDYSKGEFLATCVERVRAMTREVLPE